MSITRAAGALLLALLLAGGAAAAGDDRPAVTVPAPDSAPRDAILDAVRLRAGAAGRLSVDHIAVATDGATYAFVRATEIVGVLEDGAPDPVVMALLALGPEESGRRWRVVELWTQERDGEAGRRDVVRRVRARRDAAGLPDALLPSDLRQRRPGA
jgi:hypothetical protein